MTSKNAYPHPLAAAAAPAPIAPPGAFINGHAAMLGVLGGGQLGRMFVHAAQALGYETIVVDPDRHGIHHDGFIA